MKIKPVLIRLFFLYIRQIFTIFYQLNLLPEAFKASVSESTENVKKGNYVSDILGMYK